MNSRVQKGENSFQTTSRLCRVRLFDTGRAFTPPAISIERAILLSEHEILILCTFTHCSTVETSKYPRRAFAVRTTPRQKESRNFARADNFNERQINKSCDPAAGRLWGALVVGPLPSQRFMLPFLYLYSRDGAASRPAVHVCGPVDHKSASVNSIGGLEASRPLSLEDTKTYLSMELWGLRNSASD